MSAAFRRTISADRWGWRSFSRASSRRQNPNPSRMFSRLSRRFKPIALISCIAALLSAPLARADICTQRPAIAAAAKDPATNLVFFGSSRVQNGFDPEVFDAAMAEAGVDGIHSYNIGWPDEVFAETIVHVECLFTARPKGIKYVLFEPNLGAGEFLLPNTRRAIALFSLHGAYLVNQMMSPYVLRAMSITGFNYARRALILLAQHYTGLSWTPPDYIPWYPPRGHPLGPRENGSLKADDAYAERLRDIEAYKPQPEHTTDAQARLVLSLARYIQAHGAVPVIVTTPQYINFWLTHDLAAKIAQLCGERDPPVLDFTSPTQYAALWDPQNRMDDDHLNIRGAGIYSQLLAQELARTLREPHDPGHLCSF
ncbi:MAG: hypothetical protein WAV02_11000 [Stellaceae bacterium]